MLGVQDVVSIDPAIGYLLAAALALIFGASGVLKLRDPALFAASVANYALLPRWSERPFALTLPLAEIAAAVGVLFPATRAIAAASLALLLGVFTAAIAINLARGRADIDCGCFGPALRQELSGWLVARNLILIVVAATLVMPEGARQIRSLERSHDCDGRRDLRSALRQRKLRARQPSGHARARAALMRDAS